MEKKLPNFAKNSAFIRTFQIEPFFDKTFSEIDKVVGWGKELADEAA